MIDIKNNNWQFITLHLCTRVNKNGNMTLCAQFLAFLRPFSMNWEWRMQIHHAVFKFLVFFKPFSMNWDWTMLGITNLKYITLCSNSWFSSNLFQWTETEEWWASQILPYLQDNDIIIIIIFSSLFQGPSEHSHAFKTKYLHMFISMIRMYIDQIGMRSDASILVW